MPGVRRGAFTCVGWQVILCDPIYGKWRPVALSLWDGVPMKSYIGLYLFCVLFPPLYPLPGAIPPPAATGLGGFVVYSQVKINILNAVYMSINAPDIPIFVFYGGHLKIQNCGHSGFCANVNISFRTPDVISFPKMYCLANLHKFWTKVFFCTLTNLNPGDVRIFLLPLRSYWHLTYKFLWSHCHVTLTTPSFTPFWQSGVGGHKKTSFELWTTIIGPRSTSDKCFKAPLKMHYVGANLG